jgi:tetratricopeptide (TPR) repeat protein
MSLEAVVVWMRALEAGALLDPETMAEMWREPELADGHMSNYALGWDWRTHGAGHRSVGHSGGHLTTVRVFPQDSLAVVVLANGSAWSVDPDRIAEGLAALVVPEILSAGSRLAWEMRAGFAAVATEGRARTGAHEALDLYGRVAADPDRLDASVEREMNRLGYELLERGRTGDAVEVLRLTAAVFPDSWNAHDSLGEAYLADGNTELARMEYRRSLELNPENENAREVLRGLPADI